ncbi:MAG TPA: gamma-glutamyl-gamma-aminobutyrate hydrolase [Rhodospirillaceae bacterium]|nr:gamma-glutamyl-gamma-aminobutyrate hydrolase [Rhodospirillaceae bacterium]
MRPLILTNAYLRPKATLRLYGVKTSAQQKVYATLDRVVSIISGQMKANPLMLPTQHDEETVSAFLDHVDGIFLPGSFTNIHPSNYGVAPREAPQIFDKTHDKTDLFLIRQAREKGIPFLGVCRGMQAMNVAFGGTLHQDITGICKLDHMCSKRSMGTLDEPEYMHDLSVDPESSLAKILGQTKISVNSLHEQAVNGLGEHLVAEARTQDGLIEAISWPQASTFFRGFQWHPEYLPQMPVSKKIFAAFREAVAQRFSQR